MYHHHHILTYFPTSPTLHSQAGGVTRPSLLWLGGSDGWMDNRVQPRLTDGRTDGLDGTGRAWHHHFPFSFVVFHHIWRRFGCVDTGGRAHYPWDSRHLHVLPSTCVCPGDPRTDRRTDGRMDGWMDGRRTLIPNHDTRIARREITPFFTFSVSFFFLL
jgi:hypothetical protein